MCKNPAMAVPLHASTVLLVEPVVGFDAAIPSQLFARGGGRRTARRCTG